MTYINKIIVSVYIFIVSKRVIESIAEYLGNYFIQDIMSAKNFSVEIQIFQKNYKI
jgi:ribosomal protein S17E